MDFLSFSRRELQALCKKNKIPANITNVAMIESLKALEMVEGVEELMLPSQSGTAQSSIESLEMLEVTSPLVPPTAGRSTRRTTTAKGALESVNPATTTRRTTRRTLGKDAEAIETPAALISKTNRNKGQMVSARRNMDSQLKECADEDKKAVLVTPAVTTRSKKVQESTVKRVHSTRRSVRFAEKNDGVEMLNEVENKESQFFTKDGENQKRDLKDRVENFNELSETTDVDAISTVEEKSENNHEAEVVSDQKQDTPIGEKDNEGEKCDNEEDMPLNASNEAQQNKDGSQDVYISEIEITVERSTEELKPEEDEASQDEAAEFVENIILGSGDNIVVNESSCDNTGLRDEIKEQLYNEKDGGSSSKDVTDLNATSENLTEPTLQQGAKGTNSDIIDHLDIPVQLNEDEPEEIETLHLEEIKNAAEPNTDFSEEIPKCDVDVEMTLSSVFEGLENEPKENDPDKLEILQLEESKKAAEPVQSYADFSEQIPKSGEDVEISIPSNFDGLGNNPDENKPNETEILQLGVSGKAVDQSDESYVEFSEQIPKSGVDVTVYRTCSDNKENIGSGGKLVITRDVKMAKKSVKNAGDLDDYSLRKLKQMVKDKMETAKKSSKNENDNEAISRHALQPISENRLVDENQN